MQSIDFSFLTSRITPFASFEILSFSFRNFCDSPQRVRSSSGMPSFVRAEHGTIAIFFVKSVTSQKRSESKPCSWRAPWNVKSAS